VNWIQLLLGAFSFGIGAIVIPEKKIKAWFFEKKIGFKVVSSLLILTIFIFMSFLIYDIIFVISESVMLANCIRAFVLGNGISIFFSVKNFKKKKSEVHSDINNCSYFDEDTGRMVLRCYRYPKKNSKEWILFDDTIVFHIVGREEKSQVSLVANITKCKLSISDTMCLLKLEVSEKSRHWPIIAIDDEVGISIAKKINDYILEKASIRDK
jgi:hypothetical protein